LVDDGAVTGATLIVAVRWIRKQNPKNPIIAIPVTSKDTFETSKKECDMVITGTTPPSSNFKTLVHYYQEFTPVEDDQVIEIYHRSSLHF
jgi:predicted phosphoribosyltransferase